MNLAFPPGSPVRMSEPYGDGCVEHLLQVLLGEGRALHVRHRADFVRERAGVLLRDGLLVAACEVDEDLDVLPQVALGAHQQHGCERASPANLRNPFLRDILEGGGADHTEAQEEDVSSRVAEVTQFVEFILGQRKR